MLKAKNLALGLLLVSSAVMAQPATPTPAAPPAPPAAIDLRVQQRSNITPQEMTESAAAYRKRMAEVVARMDIQLKDAREQKDIIKINCLMDKLVQARASAGTAEKSYTTLQESIARGDQGSSLHEFTRITIVNQNVQVLASEADACVGEELSYIGATRVDVEIPPGEDPNPGTPTPPDMPERPPLTSPF
jgi:hypothetical protein